MIIKRMIEGKEVEIILTGDEISEAHKIYIVNWMRSELLTIDSTLTDEQSEMLAERAYDIYSEGDGDTEYESIEKALEEYCEENTNKLLRTEKINYPLEDALNAVERYFGTFAKDAWTMNEDELLSAEVNSKLKVDWVVHPEVTQLVPRDKETGIYIGL